MKILDTLIIICIQGYKRIRPFIDAMFLSVFGVVSKCSQTPTCSDYTIEQIKNYGTITGLKKGVTRLATCHPYSAKPTNV